MNDEMMFELMANFGEGETIVNVLTGERIKLAGTKKKVELTAEQKRDCDELLELLRSRGRERV